MYRVFFALRQRYRIFFFLIKFMGHSFNQIVKLCIFFFREAEKKNTRGYFFFPRKSSWGIHSGSGGFFFIFFESGVCFFFSTFFGFFFVFFSCKSSHVIHSFDLEAAFFFRRWKKKIQLFHSFNRFFPKMFKKWTFTGKKIRYLWYTQLLFTD